MKKRKPSALALSLILAASACQEKPPQPDISARNFLAFATQVEAPLENALAEFDAASARREAAACRASARRALEAALSARDQIEKYAVPEALVPARREELTYLNHIVAGCQAFVAGDASSGEIDKVRSIIVRGRSHQSLARAALREAEAGR
jgi:hypothetical protein